MAINNNPIENLIIGLLSYFHFLISYNLLPDATNSKIIINGLMKIKLYKINNKKAVKSKYWDNKVIIAK